MRTLRKQIAAWTVRQDGYMTAEAAFILPLAIVLVALLVVVLVWMYGCFFLPQAAYRSAFRAERGGGSKEAMTSRAETAWSELYEERLFHIGEAEHNIRVTLTGVTVEGKSTVSLALPHFFPAAVREFSLQTEQRSLRRDPVTYIRTLRLAKRVVGSE